jgi:hypothetical protein
MQEVRGPHLVRIGERSTTGRLDLSWRPDARRDRTTCAGRCHCEVPRNGLFRLGLILGGIGALADAVGLVEKVVAVSQRFLCVLVDRNRDRLDVLAFSSYHFSCSRITNSGRQARVIGPPAPSSADPASQRPSIFASILPSNSSADAVVQTKPPEQDLDFTGCFHFTIVQNMNEMTSR